MCVILCIFHLHICMLVYIDLDRLHSYVFIVHQEGKSTFSKVLPISHIQISLCTGIHKNGPIFPHKGIKIYAANSHITTKRREGKASDNFHLPARSFVHAHAQERNCRGESCVWGHRHTGREGDGQKHWCSICNCTSKKKKFFKSLCHIGSSVFLNRF